MTSVPPFALRLPANTRFGRGSALAAAPEIARYGRRLLLVHGRSPARSAPLREALEVAGCSVVALSCVGEPTLDVLEAALAENRATRPDAVVAMGGGAALDMGKALAALVPSDAPPLAHLEVVGDGRPLSAAPLPCIAIPTTAGTGSEATKNAVIGVPAHARKVSLRDDRMVPELAVIDPSLTDGTPRSQTLASGFDAVTQVIEPYLSTRATPFTDALTLPAIGIGLRSLAALGRDGENAAARDGLSYVAYVSGIALANAGLGAVHGLAGVLGGETGAAHGMICARLLPHVLIALDAQLADGAPARARLAEVADLVEGAIPGGIATMERWMTDNGLEAAQGLDAGARARIAVGAASASSMKPSPVAFATEDLEGILARAFPEPE